MDLPSKHARRACRLLCAVALTATSMSLLAPSASARDSTFRITLTLRGDVASDVGFDLAAGGIFWGWFCMSKGHRDEAALENPGAPAPAPLCRSGVTYSTRISVGKGESLDYGISKVWLREARILWSDTLVGDGRDHTLTYVYLFDLPATDAVGRLRPQVQYELPGSIARRPE